MPGALVLLLLGVVTSAFAQATTPIDYGQDSSWLCRPGRRDACAVDLTTTVVRTDGRLTREEWKPAANPPIDCFYVYPTVSTDSTPFSDMVADEAERNVIRQQFARFGSMCRLFAPMYRQVTLAGLRTMIAGGGGASLSNGPQYVDVERAWSHYLEHDNQGRGVVLVGHSQGSYILTELIRRNVDGKAAQSRLVSAILLGATLSVPRGRDVGGSFQQIPLCRAAAQTGCVITYVSFRSTSPPPPNTRFGRVTAPDQEAACTNPAALAGGAADLRAYLDARGQMIAGAAAPRPWVTPDRPVETPWVSVPGLLSARCTTNEHAGYLEITVRGDAADPRTDDIAGDLYAAGGQRLLDWGLHLIDANLAMGDLIEIVSRQAGAWRSP